MKIQIRLLYLVPLVPFPTRTEEEDKASWAIVGHEHQSPAVSGTSSQDRVDKPVVPV